MTLKQSIQYSDGYASGSSLDWLKLPLDEAIKLIDAYKHWALKKDNPFFIGVAQGAWDELMKRELVL